MEKRDSRVIQSELDEVETLYEKTKRDNPLDERLVPLKAKHEDLREELRMSHGIHHWWIELMLKLKNKVFG